MLKKQKQQSSRRCSRQALKKGALLQQYRAAIVPVQFYLKEVKTYNCVTLGDMQNIEIGTISHQMLRDLAVDALKLSFIYDPLQQTLNLQSDKYINHYPLKRVIKILFRGDFYRFINNQDNQLKNLVNNRTTEANLEILIAALMVFGARKLNVDEISTAMLFFSLQAALNPDPLCIPLDSHKIVKVLKKIERVLKPADFKTWLEAVKGDKNFVGQVEAHQFLYLCSVSQKKFINNLQNLVMQPKMASIFKNLNVNVKTADFEANEEQEVGQKKKIVRGLSFVERKPRNSFSFCKEILKEFRLRDPSKNKRPNTGLLRTRVQSFCSMNASKITENLMQTKSKPKIKYSASNLFQRSNLKRIPSKSVSKLLKASSKLKRPQFKLKINFQGNN